jgi:hypothetical protein
MNMQFSIKAAAEGPSSWRWLLLLLVVLLALTAAAAGGAAGGALLLLLQVSGELVGGWTERVPMTRCTNPDGCLGASKGEASGAHLHATSRSNLRTARPLLDCYHKTALSHLQSIATECLAVGAHPGGRLLSCHKPTCLHAAAPPPPDGAGFAGRAGFVS